MDMKMQLGHEYAAWTRICSMETNMQHGNEHAAKTERWTCRIDMDMAMEHWQDMDINMQNG
jgi:hypothetical protein